jgi:hypothetical protein
MDLLPSLQRVRRAVIRPGARMLLAELIDAPADTPTFLGLKSLG